VSAGFWLGLQQDWDLWQMLHSPQARAIEEIEPLKLSA
jgi:plasmid maintenance system antidote protein VapI